MDNLDTFSNKILGISFNQDQTCFSIGTDKGFQIFNSFPFKNTFKRDFDAGISISTMLYRTNILVLVGGGEHPKYPGNKVMLWDEHQSKCIGELTFKTNVKAIKLRRDKIVVVLESRVYIYQIPEIKLLDVIDTHQNPDGICALTPKDATILACPDKKKGYIRIVNYDTNSNIECKAHESGVYALAISHDGKLCATASDKGTLIRVFTIEGAKLLQELRRGTDKAEIQSIAFDKSSQWLASTSDKGTVHIFSLADSHKVIYENDKKADAKNPKSVFNFMKGLIPYFSSQWSFAQFRIPPCKSIVEFGPKDKNIIIVATYDGKYYVGEFNPKTGGDCKKTNEEQFFSPE